MPYQAQQNIYNTENAVINTDEDLATIVTEYFSMKWNMFYSGPQQESLLNDAYVHTTDGSPAARERSY